MRKSFRGLVAASVLAVGLGLAGCQSDKPEHGKGHHHMEDGTAMAGTDHYLMCTKCETVWKTVKVGEHTRAERLISKKDMTCPHCNEMAAAYVKDGEKVLHDCPDCKVTPVELKPMPASPTPRGSRP